MRGRNAIIVWLDEQGNRQETPGREIRYGYFRRTYLNVPKDARKYRDTESQEKGFPFASNFVKFLHLASADFEWVTDPAGAGSRQMVTLMMANGGKRRREPANDLAGAIHPLSPYIAFMVDGAEKRIELLPLSSAAERSGKPRLLQIIFTL